MIKKIQLKKKSKKYKLIELIKKKTVMAQII